VAGLMEGNVSIGMAVAAITGILTDFIAPVAAPARILVKLSGYFAALVVAVASVTCFTLSSGMRSISNTNGSTPA